MEKIILVLWVLISSVLAIPTVDRSEANQFLSRRRRANAGGIEEMMEGNLERECIEEVCNFEEAREVFENHDQTIQWWDTNHPSATSKKTPTGVIIGVVSGVIVFIIIVAIIIFAAKSAERSSRSKNHSNYPYRNESGPPPPYEVAQGMLHAGNGQMKIRDPALRAAVASCYIERNRIHLGRKIKEGNFGVVYDAKWNQSAERTRRVAAKTMKNIESQQQLENFLKEGVMMKEFNHPNIIKIYGVCTAPGEYPIIILPFMENGDLRTFLRDSNNEITVAELIGYCVDICAGMEHLASKGKVHRDLAARNVLVGSFNDEIERNIIKVGDFGLSRDLNQSDYYRSTQHSELPLKWMSPESIRYHRYTEKSDVWSFGVTMWETMTRAVAPYATVDPVYILDHIDSGNRLEKPRHCPENVYKVMKSCWAANPDSRPTFATLLTKLLDIYSRRIDQLRAEQDALNQSYPDTRSRLSSNRDEDNLEISRLSYQPSERTTNDYNPEPNMS